MNQPITLTDISTDLASRAMQALYRNGAWVETAPTQIVGIMHEGLGYIACITNDEVTAVYRYTNREQLKRLKMWPQGVADIIKAHTGIDAGHRPLGGSVLGGTVLGGAS